MPFNRIKSSVIDVSVSNDVEVSLEDFIKSGQTVPISVFKRSSISLAIQDALVYLNSRGGGSIGVPPSEDVANSLVVVLQKDMNQVLKDTFLYNNYRYPLNLEGRPYTGDSWKVGDMVINSDITNDKCVGWYCIGGGIPGVWKEYGVLQGYEIVPASDSTLGGVKASPKTTESVEVKIDPVSGKLYVPNQTDVYTLPISSSSVLGGVLAKDKTTESIEVAVDETGKLYVPNQVDVYTLPQATDTVLGGIKAKEKTTESSEVAIDGTSGKLYVSNLSSNGIVSGGTVGQVLSKVDGVDYNTQWISLPKEITNKTPSSATDTGAVGEVCWDSEYLYICTASNVWKRVAIATW